MREGYNRETNMKFGICEMGVKTDFEFLSEVTFYLQCYNSMRQEGVISIYG